MFRNLKRFLLKNLNREMEDYEIDLQELKNKQRNGAEIIDVRSIREYNENHIFKAINIPEYEINSNFQKLYPDKEKEIVLYCKSGKRSKDAYKKLKKMGYKNVYNLYLGIDNY